MGFIGVGGYLIVLKIMRVSLSSGRGFDQMGKIELSQVPILLQQAYHNFWQYFCGNELLNNDWMFRKWINAIILLTFVGLIIYKVVKDKLYRDKFLFILLIGLVAILPIGFEVLTIIAPEVDPLGTTGILLVPAMCLLYMALIWFAMLLTPEISLKKENSFLGGYIKHCYAIILVPLLWNLLLYTAAFENVMWLNYNSTYALCQKMSEKIDEFNYNPKTKIMIAGNPEYGNYPCQYKELREIVKGSLAVKGMVWQGGWLSNVCYQGIYRNYFNVNYEITTAQEYQRIIESEAYLEMKLFPNDNSVKKIEDIIVVKLSE